MRRPVIALAAITALTVTLVLAPTALAVGRGGWSRVGTGATATTASLNGTVTALNTDNPGVLYVGGNFTSAGGVAAAKRIARWNGTYWSAIGPTPLTNGQVFAIAYHAGTVYVGGTFQNAGGDADVDFLAAWNGSAWSSPCASTTAGPAITANVNALKIIGNTLYVGGSFANGAGIASADFLVGCDLTTGTASSTVTTDGSMNGAVYALTADSNGTLYAGGGFINLESIPEADHVASYDGSWHAMGSGAGGAGTAAVDSFVRSLAAYNSLVYVGTDSVNVAGIPQADHVALWDGTSWSALGANSAGTDGWFPASATIDALASYYTRIVAVGSFQNANGTATADNVAFFDGTSWRPIGSDGTGNGPLSGHPAAAGVVTDRGIYVGGNFTTAGGDNLASYLAEYFLTLPDTAIGATTTGRFIGNAVYSPTGAGEVLRMTINRGHSGHAYVKIQNDGLLSALFTLHGTGDATGFVVHYYRGTTNITGAVRNGSYVSPVLAPHADVLVRIVVSVRQSSASSATFTTTARSTTGTPHDAVRFIVKAG